MVTGSMSAAGLAISWLAQRPISMRGADAAIESLLVVMKYEVV